MATPRAFMRGNAVADGIRGWFVGQFVPQHEGLRHQDAVEIKWGVHPKGESRAPRWARCNSATTVSILVEGTFRLAVRGGDTFEETVLEAPGDYVIIAPGLEHSWEALSDSVVLSVRFPSLPDDQVLSDD